MAPKPRKGHTEFKISEQELKETYGDFIITNNNLKVEPPNCSLEFFEQYVWWWKLLGKDIEENYGKGHLSDYTDRLLKTIYFYSGLTDSTRERHDLHKYIFDRLKEQIDWMQAPDGKFMLLRAFDYEAKSRASRKYINKWNWLTLSINTSLPSEIGVDEEWEYMHFIPQDTCRELDNGEIPEILFINPCESQKEAADRFKAWRKKGIKDRGLPTEPIKGVQKPIIMQKDLSWVPLESADINSYKLIEGGLDDGARGQLSKLIRKYSN